MLTGRSNESNTTGKQKAREEEEGEEEEDEDEEERPASASHRMLFQYSGLVVAYRPLAQKLYPHHKVRTSLHDRTLESMIPVLNPSRSDGDDVAKKAVGLRDIPESSCDLTSILELRKSVQKSVHHGLSH